MRVLPFLVLTGAGITAVAAVPVRARACGGCFAPPSETTVVTGHRMVVSLSPEATTLWDRIEYAGSPDDFVWVLPVAPTARVDVADDDFFEALEIATAPVLTAIVAGGGGCPCCAGAPSTTETVTVYASGQVGPYESAVLGSEDPGALLTWLRDHGYAVPEDLEPLVTDYALAGSAFAVLRLRPDVGVQAMTPVRVTTPGLVPALPLRMIAAGVADETEIVLHVIAEGRYEPVGVRATEIDDGAIVFDWQRGYDYDEVFDAITAAEPTWVVEGSFPLPALRSYAADGTARSPDDEVAIATAGLPSPWVTRLRTRLRRDALGSDLRLGAVPSDYRWREIQVTRATGISPASSFGSCGDTGRDERALMRCSGSPAAPTRAAVAVFVIALLALVVKRRPLRR